MMQTKIAKIKNAPTDYPNKYKFTILRTFAIGTLCIYYYLSLFRKSEGLINVDVKRTASILLLFFLASTFIYLLFNVGSVYSIYRQSRLAFVVMLICVLLFTYITRESWLMIPFLLYLSYAREGFRILARQLFIYSSILYVLVVTLGLIIPELGREVIDKSYSVASVFGTNANSLGFSNSNHPLLYLTVIAVNGAYLITSKSKKKLYALVMFALATIVFIFTLSITGYVCIAIFLVLYYFSTKRILSFTKRLIPIVVILSIIITPVIASNFGQDYRSSVNQALSNRPYLWSLRLSDGAYKNLIGNVDQYQSQDDEKQKGYTLDNQYLQLIARYGWISLFIFLYIYFIGLKRITNPAVITGLLAFSIYFIFESVMYILVISIIPVAMIGAKLNARTAKGLRYQNGK